MTQKRVLHNLNRTALNSVIGRKIAFRGFGILPNKRNLSSKPQSAVGQIYGKGTPFLCLLRNLFFLLQLIRSLPFRGLYCFPVKGRVVRGTDRKGKEWVFCISVFLFSLLNESVFSISLFNCIGFSDVGLPGIGKSNIGFPNIGRFMLCLAWKIAIASLPILLCICYSIERHFAGLRYKSLPSIKMRPESRI